MLLLLLNIFVVNCALADSSIIHRCRFRTELSCFVVTVPMMLLGHHRRHKLACCTGVAFDVVVFLSFCAEKCVSVYMFVCCGCFEQIHVVSTNFRYVTVRAFGVF